mmetsp:Transcript_26370/g.85165  ORF Transcript_26370/g.85165 Transcript_26370/m.85165 type:complete len:348 (+) Transcript_26370:2278-3321(+)
MMERMKSEVLGELRKDIQDLTKVIRDSNREVQTGMHRLATEVRTLHQDVDHVRQRSERGQFARLFSCLATPLCCGGEDLKGLRKGRLGADAVDEPEPQLIPSTMVPGSVGMQAGAGVGVAPAAGGGGTPAKAKQKSGLLGPIVQYFGDASRGLKGSKEVERVPFIEGLGAYAMLLDKMGGSSGMGSYLEANIKKLRSSKADKNKSGYREWLLSELPIHGQTSYKEYVDESAWMANLWIGWTLDFFVELFAELHLGKDTKTAAADAYNRTLYNHHNFFQRTAFNTAVKQLPPRDQILKSLQGGGSSEDVHRELGEFVALARPLAAFCSECNEQMDKRLQVERKAYLKR